MYAKILAMTPERFVSKKVAQFGLADLQEVKELLDKISLVNGADRIAEALDELDKTPAQTADYETAKQVLRNKILAYVFWWQNCVAGGQVLRGNISLWQKTPDPGKLSFEATFGRH